MSAIGKNSSTRLIGTLFVVLFVSSLLFTPILISVNKYTSQNLLGEVVRGNPSLPNTSDISDPSPPNPNGPYVTFSSPYSNDSFIAANKSVTFLVEVDDPGAGATMDKLAQVFLNGTWWDMEDKSGGSYTIFEFECDLSANHSQELLIPFNFTNSLWQSNVYFINVTVDAIAPTYTIHAPTASTYIKSDITISVEADDAFSGMASVQVVIENSTENLGTENLVYNGLDRWEYDWLVVSNDWGQDTYNLSFIIKDQAGVEARENFTVFVDYTPPMILLLSPANNSIVSKTFNLSLRISDPNSDIIQAQIKVGAGGFVIITPTLGDVYNTSIDTTQYADGILTILINAQNYAGDTNNTIIHFSVDNSPPLGLVTGNFTVSGEGTFVVTASDLTGLGRIAWRIDDFPYHELTLVASQTFTINAQVYSGGNHTLTLLVGDSARPSNANTTTYSLLIDKEVPNVAIRNLLYGEKVPRSKVLDILVYDDNLAFVKLYFAIDQSDAEEVAFDPLTGAFSLPLNTYRTGTHHFYLIAIDVVGNQDSDEYLFILYEPDSTISVWWYVLLIGSIVAGIVVLGVFINRRRQYRYWRDLSDEELEKELSKHMVR